MKRARVHHALAETVARKHEASALLCRIRAAAYLGIHPDTFDLHTRPRLPRVSSAIVGADPRWLREDIDRLIRNVSGTLVFAGLLLLLACEPRRVVDIDGQADLDVTSYGQACLAPDARCPFSCVETASTMGNEGTTTVTECASLCRVDAECPPGTTCNGAFCERSCKSDDGCSFGSVCRRGVCAPHCVAEPTVCPSSWPTCEPWSGHCVSEGQ